MGPLIRLSLRARLMIFVLLALLPAFALIIYNAIEAHRRATEEVIKAAQRLARLAGRQHEKMIGEAYDLVMLLTRLPLVVENSRACQNLLTNLPEPYPEFANVMVVDRGGTVQCSSRPKQVGINYRDRRWFQQAVESGKFVASEYLIGRLNREPSVVFAAPMLDREGSLKAVVSLSIHLDWVNRLSDRAELPAGSTLTLLDTEGTVLARQPENDWIGAEFPRLDLARALLKEAGAGALETVERDGSEHLYAFHPLTEQRGARSWHLAISIPKAAAYAAPRSSMLRNLFFMGLVAVLVLATAWWGSNAFVLAPIRALVDTSAKLGTGDLRARTGMSLRTDELGRLAHAFDDMAEAIQSRESARLQAEQAGARLAAIVESSSDAIIGRTLDGVITSWNQGAERLFGYRAEEILGESILRLVPDDERQTVLENFARIRNGARIDSYEAVRLHKTGARIHVSVTVSPITDADGVIIGASSIARDISAHKRAENELRALHDINLAISSTLDREAVLNMLLEKIDLLLPYSASHIRLWNDVTGRLDPVACRNLDEEEWKSGDAGSRHVVLRTIMRTQRYLVIDNLQNDERSLRRPFYQRHGLVSYLGMPLIVKGQAIGVLSLLTKEAHEFTEHEIRFLEALAKQASIAIYNSKLYEESRRLLDDLAASKEQIRALANGLMRAQDEEARRIAHVLHDESGQVLAMVYISLDELARSLSSADQERVAKIKNLLDEVEERLRDLSHELYPAMLDHLGLIPSLEYLAAQMSKRAGIRITIDGDLSERLSPLLELTIYRVVQEAFNNVLRHAGARSVHVRLFQDHRLIQCAIQDDGIGFDSGPGRRAPLGLGLPGMRERVEAAGGTFEIFSAPNSGTKIFIAIPREKLHGPPDPAG